MTSWTAAYQAPLSMGFSRQEFWSGLPCPPPGDLPDPGIEPASPALQADSLLSEPSGKPDGGHILVGILCVTFFKDYIYILKNIFYLFIWLLRVLVAACRLFSCSMQTLSCSMWDLVPRPRIKPRPPALGAWSLSHWTTREVPIICLF